jgi:hypothetical protein
MSIMAGLVDNVEGVDVSALEVLIRSCCLELPEATERLSHGTPSFFVGKQFLMLWPDGHHDAHVPQLWCAAPPGATEACLATEPDRYFTPPYVGSRGWLGVRLDRPIDPGELRSICRDAYLAVAPPRLVARVDTP